MKANELRIGNLVYYKNTKDLAKVELIHNKHFDCRDEYGSFTPNGNYAPIPLSEEILLKCGFEEWEKERLHIPIPLGNLCFTKGLNGVSLLGYQNKILGNVVRELHQLQNLYFALTGQELNTSGL